MRKVIIAIDPELLLKIASTMAELDDNYWQVAPGKSQANGLHDLREILDKAVEKDEYDQLLEVDPVYWDWQRLTMANILDVIGVTGDDDEEVGAIQGVVNFMDAMSDTWWPEVTDSYPHHETPVDEIPISLTDWLKQQIEE